jgi:sugar (pentulose or hexulose) kinase
MDAYEIYAATGVQLELVSTISQLYSLAIGNSPQLEAADSFLMIPSLFAYFLTGNRADEHSNVSNSALLDFKNDAPVPEVFDSLGIPQRIMPKAVKPGTVLGPLLSSVQLDTGMGAAPVIAPATHDTASAVISVPADPSTDWAFLSCGTWSIVGIETERPLTSKMAFEAGVTSAATADGKYMPRINITGLWILQELRRIWERQGDSLDWGTMMRMAESAKPFAAYIDVDSSDFVSPPDMPKAIAEYLQSTRQNVPQDKGGIIRVAVESLALKYRDRLAKIEALTGRRKQVLHIVGGGVRNTLLCQFTADATGIPVVAGPVEATAMGNLLVQMVGAGVFSSVAEGRQALRDSSDVVEYAPTDTAAWDEAYEKYLRVV